MKDLNRLYTTERALFEVDFSWEGFNWIDIRDVDNSVISFVRRAKDPNDFLAVVANFTPVPREGYRMGVPVEGVYREILNSDSREYGGGGIGNPTGVPSEPTPWQGQAHSIVVTVPPLAVMYLR
jgi:1,4-alpha-glucan branching enzyme